MSLNRVTLSVAAAALISTLSVPAFANCNATINGRPMTLQECALVYRVYGRVIPGAYLMDRYGNWVNVNNRRHRGNIYRDSEGSSSGSWGGGSYVSPHGVYDSSGGCEGGSCVNIID